MISRFFIDRPIFANVIAIVTVIFGLVALRTLPIEQYPQITPPTVQVTTNYPGADAQVVCNTVATPVEQQVNGVEGMLYMKSTCSADGSYNLIVTFDVGTNLDVAQVLVQNRVAIATPQLPEEVRRQGITVKKQSTNIILFVTLFSPDRRYDSLYLANYGTLHVRDELTRVPGVGDVSVFGAGSYSMRVWLDPPRLKALGLTTEDVTEAIAEQNVQVAAGRIGQPPVPEEQTLQLTVTALGRLSTPEEFESIIVKADGPRLVRLGDVARIELGSQVYDQFFQKNGNPSAGIAVFQLPGANALQVAEDVRVVMERLAPSFPEGMVWEIPFDTTQFVSHAIAEVYWTLFEAGILVLIVILVFLQDWRALLVPATTVPVTIIGAFAGLAIFGFTVNLLTLFGLILAIGIVVDDAIVIVENAAHHIAAEGVGAREATIRAMSEVTGPVISITLVLMAVFLPSAMLGGITGELYRQFALTIAITAVISAVNALTLKPAQCAAWLRKPSDRKNAFFRAFNRMYERTERRYLEVVRWLVVRTTTALVAFSVLLVLTLWAYLRLPTGFLPTEDQGYVIAGIQLPDAASLARTSKVMDRVNEMIRTTPGVVNWNSVGGRSILDGTTAPNAATFYIVFAPWAERQDDERLTQAGILGSLRKSFSGLQEANAFVFPPPAIRGLGVAGGFQMEIEDRGSAGAEMLQQVVQEMVQDGDSQSALEAMQATFRAGVPQIFVDVDRTKVKSLGIPLSSVFGTLQTYLGSNYVNDFTLFGRTYQVRVQAEPAYRLSADDINRLDVRNPRGEMVPLSTLVDVQRRLGPQIVSRYNLYPSASISGQAAAGYSSGDALALMEEMARSKLPPSMGFEWTGVSLQEKKVGGEAVLVFLLAVVLVYLVLAAQYESWTSPAAVVLVVPLALLGTSIFVALRGMDNNVYTQIGVVLLIALASKNAILIVEFARDRRAAGVPIEEAAIEASRLRFRPILMTSFAFLMGIWPLVFASGAGAVSRRALGTAVFGGMLSSTLLAVLFAPVFYVAMQRLSEWRHPRPEPAPAEPELELRPPRRAER